MAETDRRRVHSAAMADDSLVTLALDADRRVREVSLDDAPALVADPRCRLLWTSASAPDEASLTGLAAAFGLHDLAAEDLHKRGQRPKLDHYDEHSMVVAYEAVAGDRPTTSEIHLFVSPRWLVSVHWTPTPALDAARSRFRAAADERTDTAGELLYVLLDAAVDSYFPVLDAISDRIDGLEDRVVEDAANPGTLVEILALKRDLLELRRVLAPMRDVANELIRHDTTLIRKAALPYYQDLYDHLVRVLDQLDLYRDLLATVLDVRMAAVGNDLNAIMKRLTAITVILMVPTLIAGIYGMNFDVMPELAWPFGYPFAILLMVAAAGAAITFFSRRGWF
jgi:magnesium transporter